MYVCNIIHGTVNPAHQQNVITARERERERVQSGRKELTDGTIRPLAGLYLHRSTVDDRGGGIRAVGRATSISATTKPHMQHYNLIRTHLHPD